MYNFIYENETEFKKLERGLGRINMLAYKKLMFEIYPELKNGDLRRANKNGSLFEIELPSDMMFGKVHGKIKITFEIIDNNIKLIEILPREIILNFLDGKTTYYKGVVVSKNNDKDIFKINLLNMLNKD